MVVSKVNGINPEIIDVVDFSEIVKEMLSEKHKSITERIRSEESPAAKNKLKQSLPGFCIGRFRYRNSEGLEEYDPHIAFDLDHIKDPEATLEVIKSWPYCGACSYSVGGRGIRVVVNTDSTLDNRKEYWSAIANAISALTGIRKESDIRSGLIRAGFTSEEINSYVLNSEVIDSKPFDVTRFWFYCYHPELFVNEDAQTFRLSPVSKYTGNSEYRYEISEKDKVEAYIQKLESSRIDITPGFNIWFKVGCALVDEFGESGRRYFHRIGQFHKDYSETESDKEYDRCLRKAKGNVKIASFYQLCKDHGVTLSSEDYSQIAIENLPDTGRSMSLSRYMSSASGPIHEDVNPTRAEVDAESAIIGCILNNEDCLVQAHESVPGFSSEMFADPINRDVMMAIEYLHSRDMAITEISVSDRLRTMSSRANTNSYMHVDDDVSTLARLISDSFSRRILASSFKRWANELISGKEVSEVLATSAGRISEIADKSDRRKELPIHVIAEKVREEAIKTHLASLGGNERMTGATTGISGMDDSTGGLQPSDLLIIAARPGMGKTAMAMKMAYSAALAQYEGLPHGAPVGIASLEMSSIQLVQRLFSVAVDIRLSRFRKGGFTVEEGELLEDVAKEISSLPIYIDDNPEMSIYDIERKVAGWKAKHGIKIVIIDYLQLLEDHGSRQRGLNRERMVAEQSRIAKKIAKKYDLAVIALSQLSRAVEIRGGTKRPQLSDLRESGALEQDADIVAFIYRPEVYQILEDEEGRSLKGVAEVIIAKNRSGALETIKTRYNAEYTRFEDVDPDEMNLEKLDHPTLEQKRDQLLIKNKNRNFDEDIEF